MMIVSAQCSTPVQLNEELVIVTSRSIDIDTVWVVGVACVNEVAVRGRERERESERERER
jgi:hypothetical protein